MMMMVMIMMPKKQERRRKVSLKCMIINIKIKYIKRMNKVKFQLKTKLAIFISLIIAQQKPSRNFQANFQVINFSFYASKSTQKSSHKIKNN